MNLAQTSASAALAAVGALCNGGTLTAYNGTQPATPETALSGNTALVAVTYSATAFGTPSYSSPNMVATASFTGNGNPTTNGGATFCRAVESNGTTVIADFSCGSDWVANNVTAAGQYCFNGGNTYKCTAPGTTAASGGPTGTGSSITDGDVTWQYIGAGQLFDVLWGNCNILVGTAAAPSQTMTMPAV